MAVSILLLMAQLAAFPLPPAAPASPAQAGEDTLTLSMAVARARSASPRRAAAAAIADGAREAARLAARWPNPIFELRTENWSTAGAAAAPPLDLFAVASQPIELAGKRGVRRRLATAERDVADASLAAFERQLATDAVRAYFRALKARALVQTLSANRDGLSTLVAGVQRQVDEGYTAEADLLKFKTEAARIDGDIARAELDMERSLVGLGTVIGAAAPVRAAQLVEPAALEPPAIAASSLRDSMARHPSVLAADAAVERARQASALERARRLPEPLMTAGYKRTAGFDTAVAGVSVVVPLFDRNSASIARALADERASVATRDATIYELTNDAAAMIRAAHTMTARARSVPDELLAPAEAVRRAAIASFREGAADVLKLIDAERVYSDVRRVAIELRLDALQAVIEARFAVGEVDIP
jgi:cobalt-zinc-cadmium efflux system outer membrane protein